MAGATATTTTYTARNHRGWAIDRARTDAGSAPMAIRTATTADHARAKASTGRTSRASRLPSQAPYPRPSRTAAVHEAVFEKPPTTKKTGMIWKIHVSHRAAGAASRTLPAASRPSRHSTAAISQWPSTTTASENTRRKST